jgi:hypothetical protein
MGRAVSRPVRDHFHFHVASGGVAVGADLLMRLVDEGLEVGLRQTCLGHVERHREAEAVPVARADGDGALDCSPGCTLIVLLRGGSSASGRPAGGILGPSWARLRQYR